MSHFVVLAIVPRKHGEFDGKILRSSVSEEVDALLEPFNEAIEVEEYDEECWCIGNKANSDANDTAINMFGKFDIIRNAFHTREDIVALRAEKNRLCDIVNSDETTNARIKEIANMIDDEWRKHTDPYNNAVKAALDVHPDKNKPNPACEDCKGTGIRQATYNPMSKWDWYEIGGRWTGMFTAGYDPNKDPRNLETCPFCNGTGTRTDWPEGITQEWIDECNGCNACHGTGQRVKYKLADFDGDILEMPKVIQSLMAQNDRPYAILTPEGEWAENGEMGWFGISNDEMTREEWYAQSMALMQKYDSNEYIGVVVDCHI
jgi:hypothetical protein